MKTLIILTASIIASTLIYLMSLRIARLTNRTVTALVLAVFGLYGVFLFLMPGNWLLIDLVVVSVAGIGGSGLGLLLSTRSSLVIFCIIASVVDIYSVSQGPTSVLIEGYRAGTSDLLRYLVLSMPIDGRVVPVVGIGDFFMVSAVYFVLIRLGFNQLHVALVPLSGLLVAIVVGLQVGGIFAIPFIAATTFAYLYWQNRVRA